MSFTQVNNHWPLDTRQVSESTMKAGASRSQIDKPLTPSQFSSSKTAKKLPAQLVRLKAKTRSMGQRGLHASFLVRSSQKAAPVEQERLYEDNISLKVVNNTLKKDCSLLKTKLQQLEASLNRKEEKSQSKYSHFVHTLKQTVRDLKTELRAKDQEIHRLKQAAKVAKYNEYEIEIQAYIDECTRLRHHLEQVLRQRSGLENECPSLELRHAELNALVGSLRNENQQLKQARSRKGSLELEAFDETERAFGTRVANFLQVRGMEPREFLSSISTEQYVDCALLSQELLQLGFSATREQIESWCAQLLWRANPSVPTELLLSGISSCARNDVPDQLSKQVSEQVYEQLSEQKSSRRFDKLTPPVKEAFEHIALRMHLAKVPKDDVLKNLFGVRYSPKKRLTERGLREMLAKKPFCFGEEASPLVQFLLKGDKTYEAVGQRLLECSPNWRVLEDSEEEALDQRLALLIRLHFDALQLRCQELDMDNSGTVTVDQFVNVLNTLDIEIGSEIIGYLQGLFYSYSYTLNRVPYPQFLEAYCKDQFTEDSDTDIMQSALEQIANKLNAAGVKAEDHFPHDDNGKIASYDFFTAVEALKIDGLDRETIVLLIDSLQFHLSQDISVSLLELMRALVDQGLRKELAEFSQQQEHETSNTVILNESPDLK